MTVAFLWFIRQSQGQRKGCYEEGSYRRGNVLNDVQKVLEIEKGHDKKIGIDQNTDLPPFGGTHDPWQEV